MGPHFKMMISVLYLFTNNAVAHRLPAEQQPRELDHRAQVRLLRRGGDGVLRVVPQDAQPQAQQPHHTLLLQRGMRLTEEDTRGSLSKSTNELARLTKQYRVVAARAAE